MKWTGKRSPKASRRPSWLKSLSLALSLSVCGSLASGTNSIDLSLLLDVIAGEESGLVPFPDGAVKIETMADGTHEIARGRYQIIEQTWKHYTKWDVSWAHEPGHARAIGLMILADCRRWYPLGGPARLDYCYSAGLNAQPYKVRRKALRAERVAAAYARRWKP